MKKLLAIVLATVMVASMFAVSASAFMDVVENFTSLPAGLEGREDVAVQQNKALKISYLDMEDGGREWGYKGWIQLSDEMIDYDSTVSFYFKTMDYPDGWCYRLFLVLSDAIGRADESQTLGGIATGSNKDRTPANRGLGYVTYDSEHADGPGTYPKYYDGYGFESNSDEDKAKSVEIVADTWYRIDLLVNFTDRTTSVYLNGEYYAVANFSPNAAGYKGLKTYLGSSGNMANDFYVDEIVVREGLVTPEDDDIIANQDRDAIEAAEGVIAYKPFDALGANDLSNTSKVPWASVEIDGFNQSTLLVSVPQADVEFADAYIPLSDLALEGNATVSFKMMAEYIVKKLPGLEIKLVGADNAVLGGFIVGADAAKLMFDDGENVYPAKDADGEVITIKAKTSYNVTLLLNHSNHSLTLYLDNVRIGTVAVEDDTLTGFTGVLLSKQATTGSKPMSFTFDNLKAVEGLYVPGSEEALDENDELVQIDTVYVEETTPTPTTKAPDPDTTPADNNNETTPADNDVTTKAPETDAPKAEDNGGSCGGVSLGAVVALAVGMFGLGFTVIKKK